MEFSSLIFLCVYMPLFFLVYFLDKTKSYRNTVLFLFSMLFYAWGEPIYVFLILASMVVNFYSAIFIDKCKEIVQNEDKKYRYADIKYNRRKLKFVFVFAVVFNLLMLGIFKYTDFFIVNINNMFGAEIPLSNIPLPIGISFYTFQILSYVVDVYYGRVDVQRNFVYLGAYIVAFPQLIAGPIVRYQTIEEELENRKESRKYVAIGLRRFIVGLGKKVLIANSMAQVIMMLESYSNIQYKTLGAIIIVVAYTLQIYFDFSGYSDMAIGLGKMMGFNYNENFNYPYIASSVTEFWRRWHISLSTFFRDYVYIPLGGNRVKPIRHILNILIVWFLTGMWHGASWNFILWGLYYAILLILEKYMPSNIKEKMPKWLGHILTIIIVMYGWIIFKFEDMTSYSEFISTLFGKHGFGSYKFLENIGLVNPIYIVSLILGIAFSTPIIKMLKDKYDEMKWFKYIWDVMLLIIFFMSLISLVAGSYNPFIYFKF